MVSLNLKVSSNSRPLPSAGPHLAALVAIVGTGTTRSTFVGDAAAGPCDRFTLALIFELLDALERQLLLKPFALSSHPKSKLVQTLAAWGALSVREGETIGVPDFLGKRAIVQVEHKLSATGKPFAAIGSVGPVLPGLPDTQPQHRPFVWMPGDGPIPSEVDELPYLYGKPLREAIEQSPEFKAWAAKLAGSPAPVADADQPF
jgi:hypothetical protein